MIHAIANKMSVPSFDNAAEAMADALACLRGHEGQFIRERATARDRKARASQAISDPPVGGYYDGYVLEAGSIMLRLDQLGYRIVAKPALALPQRYPMTVPGQIPLGEPLIVNQELPSENAK